MSDRKIPPGMTKHIHLCLSIEGALANWGRSQYESCFPEEPNWKKAKKWLELQRFNGKKVLPFGEACEGFSYETGCPGHTVPIDTVHRIYPKE